MSSHHRQGNNKNMTGLTFCKKKIVRIIVGGLRYNIIIVLKCIKSETTCQFDRSVKLELCTQDFWVGSSVSFWMRGELQLAHRVLGMNLLQRAQGLCSYAMATLTYGAIGAFWFGVCQESSQQENGGQQLSPANDTCHLHIVKYFNSSMCKSLNTHNRCNFN